MSKHKWRRGPKILSLDELARQEVAFWDDKPQPRGWFMSEQFRMAAQAVGKNGVIFYAMPAGVESRFSDEQILLAEKRMGTMVQERIKELLDLPEILDRKIDILADYRSDIDELKDIPFTMPSNHITAIQEAEKSQRHYITSGEKLFLLEQFEIYLETYLADWEEFLKTYKKKFETAEEEYFSGKREELPDMAQIFVKTMLKKYMNNRYNTNKNTENIIQ